MNLVDALQYPAGMRVVLVTLTGVERVIGWTASGADWVGALLNGWAGFRLIGVEVDGSALAPDLWSWDAAAGSVTVDGSAFSDTANPQGHTVFAVCGLGTANRDLVFEANGERVPYLGILDSTPELRLGVDEYFGGVGSIGGGTIRLRNADHLFSRLKNWTWRTCVCELGIDLEAG